jgi:hypothetical protein
MISLFAIIALGFLLGMRHATDPDHVIAVSTIVSRERDVKHAAMIGVAWGAGHTLTIVTVGSIMIMFRLVLPARVGLAMELAVALMLIVLGIRNMGPLFNLSTDRHRTGGHSGFHAHGDYIHAHAESQTPRHSHDPERTPLRVIDRWFGGITLYQVLRPLLVGVVHGLAGSAAIALLVLSTIQSYRWAAAYLVIFGIGTILGMVLITITIASTFSLGQRRFANIGQHFGVASGVVSVMFGLFIAYQVGYINGLFTGHVRWIPH